MTMRPAGVQRRRPLLREHRHGSVGVRRHCVERATVGILLFDYLMKVGIFAMTKEGVFTGALLGVGFLASNYFGFLTGVGPYLRYHWLLKTLEGFVMIPFIVVKLTQAHTYSFMLFSVIGMASFVLQYVPLFFVLKWASNRNDDCPKPSEVFVFPFCSKNLDDSVGGVLKWDEYEAQQKEKAQQKKKNITPINP